MKALNFAREECAGCGARAGRHPWVGIRHVEGGGFEALPICQECWQDPAHRKRPIKAHFFPESQKLSALKHAGSSSIG